MAKAKRGPKPPDDGVTPEEFDAMAKELLEIAEKISTHAQDMRALGIEKIYPLMGNYDFAQERLTNWVNKQFVPKFFEAATQCDAYIEIKVNSNADKQSGPKKRTPRKK